MSDQKPFKLKRILVVYNIFQIICNFINGGLVSEMEAAMDPSNNSVSVRRSYSQTKPQLVLLTRVLG